MLTLASIYGGRGSLMEIFDPGSPTL